MNQQSQRVAMTDYDFPSLEVERRAITAAGAEFTAAQCTSAQEVVDLCRHADVVITEYYRPFDRAIIEQLECCRAIVRTGIGYDTIDVPAATEHGIQVVNVPTYCLEEVAEHALALIFALARKLVRLHGAVLAGRWDFKVAQPLHRLRGSTLGVIGCGRIGRRVSLFAKALGLHVRVVDPYVAEDLLACLGGVPGSLEEVLEVADFVTLHVPLNAETHGMIGLAELRRMKPTACLVNTARGPLVQHAALVQALQAGWLAGAGLDVIEHEPLRADDPLLKMDNVVFTPHGAWYSEESIVALHTTIAEEVLRVLARRRPASLVNPEVLERLPVH